MDPTAAATGELIYRLALSLGLPITAELATCLYTALMTDTGNFSYSNTTGDTLRIAGALLDAGANGYDLNLRVYRNTPFCKLRLLGVAIGGIRLYEQDPDRHGQPDPGPGGSLRRPGGGYGRGGGLRAGYRYRRDRHFPEGERPGNLEGEPAGQTLGRRGDHGGRLGGGGHARAAGYTAKGGLEAVWAQALAAAKEALG